MALSNTEGPWFKPKSIPFYVLLLFAINLFKQVKEGITIK